MKYVLDSSVAVKWVLPERHSDKALQLRDDFRNTVHELISPDFFPTEAAHAIIRAERQGGWHLSRGFSFLLTCSGRYLNSSSSFLTCYPGHSPSLPRSGKAFTTVYTLPSQNEKTVSLLPRTKSS